MLKIRPSMWIETHIDLNSDLKLNFFPKSFSKYKKSSEVCNMQKSPKNSVLTVNFRIKHILKTRQSMWIDFKLIYRSKVELFPWKLFEIQKIR